MAWQGSLPQHSLSPARDQCVRVATKTDLRELELRLNGKLTELETKLTIRAAVIAVVGHTALVGALHYWPPH